MKLDQEQQKDNLAREPFPIYPSWTTLLAYNEGLLDDEKCGTLYAVDTKMSVGLKGDNVRGREKYRCVLAGVEKSNLHIRNARWGICDVAVLVRLL